MMEDASSELVVPDGEGESFSAFNVHLDGTAVMVLRGQLDMRGAELLRDAMDGLVRTGPPAVILDLSDLSFLDSAGLAALIRAHREISRQDRRLILRWPEAQPLGVLELSGALDFLHIEVERDI
ncbi:MAG: anti-sigma factor antagonist [Acidimicrobiaceae bacterium]|nr:anti-sigma factor antagonist [Acidimicrobiaceae bacterium]